MQKKTTAHAWEVNITRAAMRVNYMPASFHDSHRPCADAVTHPTSAGNPLHPQDRVCLETVQQALLRRRECGAASNDDAAVSSEGGPLIIHKVFTQERLRVLRAAASLVGEVSVHFVLYFDPGMDGERSSSATPQPVCYYLPFCGQKVCTVLTARFHQCGLHEEKTDKEKAEGKKEDVKGDYKKEEETSPVSKPMVEVLEGPTKEKKQEPKG